MIKHDFLSLSDYSPSDLSEILLLARSLKKQNKPLKILAGKTVGLIFQKPSTRTTVSFAVGVVQLGGHPLILNADVLQMKRGESPKDTGRVLSRYLDALVMRATRHAELLELARYASIPVINGLTDQEHPCQVLADLLTIMEHRKMTNPKQLRGFQLSYFGDGNNVSQSLVLAAGLFGLDLKLACPDGYEPGREFIEQAKQMCKKSGGSIQISSDPKEAARESDALYTDVWASMGQEAEIQKRKEIFADYQLNEALLALAKPKALVMHCLPAHRGEEITDEAMEGASSVVFDQAENRLHVQKAILVQLVGSRRKK